MSRLSFIEPSAPVLRREPPAGPEWLHEVKHDGWLRPIAEAVALLPAKNLILDAELVACDAEGQPSFGALMSGARHGCCAFDLLDYAESTWPRRSNTPARLLGLLDYRTKGELASRPRSQ